MYDNTNCAEQIGWLFMYVFAFGISDFFAEKYLKSKLFYMLYYCFLGIIGAFIILHFPAKKY